MTQLRCKFGPLIFLMRESGCNSVSPNLLKSSDGQGKSDMPMPPPPPAAGAALLPDITPLTKPCTSSSSILPLGPEPCTRESSTPSSRANLRTDGEACGFCPLPMSVAAALAARGMDAACGAGVGAGGAGGAACPACATCAAGAGGAACGDGAGIGEAVAASASSMRIKEPSATLSPIFTFNSLTTPAWLLGISMLALSDSTVISDCSALTVSPGLTSSSMTSTSLKSPMSGTLIST